jgi:hypothetical protein
MFLWILLIWYVSYLYVWDANPPVIFNEEILPVKENTVLRGGYVTVNPSGCRYTNVPVTIYYSIVDGMEYNMPRWTYVGSAWKNECFDWKNTGKTYRIPTNIPNGIYHLHIKLEYKVNRLVTRYVNIETEEFEITWPAHQESNE